jgi:hypothetical protein
MDAQENAVMNAYGKSSRFTSSLMRRASRLDQHLAPQNTAAMNTTQRLAAAQEHPARDPTAKPEWIQQKKPKDKAAEVWHHPQR